MELINEEGKYWHGCYWVPIIGENVYVYIPIEYTPKKLLAIIDKLYKIKMGTRVGTNLQGCVCPSYNEEVPGIIMYLCKDVSLDTLVHECMHVVQFILETRGFYDETSFNDEGEMNSALKEMEAYMMGEIVSDMFYHLREIVVLKPQVSRNPIEIEENLNYNIKKKEDGKDNRRKAD